MILNGPKQERYYKWNFKSVFTSLKSGKYPLE